MKILIVEDEPMVMHLLVFRMKKDGYEVVAATDGRQAMKLLENNSFDLVITDIMMPFHSGLEILKKVRDTPGKRVPVIILSAMGQEDAVVNGLKLGADDYISKPFVPHELSARVKRLLSY